MRASVPPRGVGSRRTAVSSTAQALCQRHPTLIVCGVFLLAALLLTGEAMLPGRTLGPMDTLELGDPWRTMSPAEPQLGNRLQNDQVEQLPFVVEWWRGLRAGDVQLWEPDIGGGVPLLTTVYNRILAPWNVAFLVLPAAKAAATALAMAFFVAQLGTYLLARRLDLSRTSAVIAGVVYGLSGTIVSNALRIHETYLFPLVAFALHATITAERGLRLRYSALLAVSFGALLLSGFPGVAAMSAYALGAYAAYLLAVHLRGSSLPATIRRAGPPALGLGLGVGIALFQLLPSFEFLQVSQALERDFPIDSGKGVLNLATIWSDRLFGAYQFNNRWAEGLARNPFEGSMAVGGAALVLAMFGLVHRREQQGLGKSSALDGFFLPLGVLSVIVGFFGGVLLRIVQVLPFMANNHLGRSRFFFVLALALLAGAGFDRLTGPASGRQPPRWSVPAVALWGLLGVAAYASYEAVTLAIVMEAPILGQAGLVAVLGVAAAIAAHRVTAPLRAPSADLDAPTADVGQGRRLVVGGLLVVVIAAELAFNGWHFTPVRPVEEFYPTPAFVQDLRDDIGPGGPWRFIAVPMPILRPNTAVVHDVRDVRTAWPAHERFRDLLRAADPGVFDGSRLKTRFTDQFDPLSAALDAMSVRYIALGREQAPLDAVATDVDLEVDVAGTSFRIATESGAALRGVGLRLAPTSACDEDGTFDLSFDGITSQRIVRDRADLTTFHLPDLAPDPDRVFTLESPSCPVVVAEQGVLHSAREGSALTVQSVAGPVVVRRTTALPRVEVAGAWRVAGDPATSLRLVTERTDEGVVLAPDPQVPAGGSGTAELIVDDPDLVRVRATTEGGGIVVLRDVQAPGWTVTVDGRPAPMLTVDHAFRGVAVPDGASVVEFDYAPRTFILGAWLSALCLAIAIGLAASSLVAARMTRRRRQV